MTTGSFRWRVTYQRPIEYEIVNAPDLFHPQNEALLSVGRLENARRFIVVDGNVERYYSAQMRPSRYRQGKNCNGGQLQNYC